MKITSFLSFTVPENITKTSQKGEWIDFNLISQTTCDKVPCRSLKETKPLGVKIRSRTITEQKLAKNWNQKVILFFTLFFFVLKYHLNLLPEIKWNKNTDSDIVMKIALECFAWRALKTIKTLRLFDIKNWTKYILS